MLLDVVLLLAFILAAFKGFSRGLIVALASFIGYLIGLAAAIKLSAVVAQSIGATASEGSKWLPLLSFVIVFVVVVILVRLLAKAVQLAVQSVMLGWVNRLGGFVFYVLAYLLILSVTVFYLSKLSLLESVWQHSVTYPYLLHFAPYFISALAVLVPFLKGIFDQLSLFFGQFAAK